MHGRMYRSSGHVLWRRKNVIEKNQNRLEAAGRTGERRYSRGERVRAEWPQIVPGWQPSCERLPAASWDVAGSGIGKMALYFASWCLFCLDVCATGMCAR